MKVLALVVLFLLLTIGVVATSTTYQSCQEEQIKIHQTQQRGAAQFFRPLTAIIRCSGSFVDKNGSAITAAFTVILGVATILLWKATRDLVVASEQSSQQQLRAYVSVEPDSVFNFGDAKNRLVISVILKNHGATPASEISHEFSMGIFQNPLPSNFDFPQPARLADFNSSVFPGNTLPTRFIYDSDITIEEVDAIETNKKRFYLWGFTHYRDAFGKKRTTKFCASFGGSDFAETTRNLRNNKLGPDGKEKPGWYWDWASGHNETS